MSRRAPDHVGFDRAREWPIEAKKRKLDVDSATPISKRPLGKARHRVTFYGLGGLFTVARHDEAVEIVNRAIDLGINYVDRPDHFSRAYAAIFTVPVPSIVSTRPDE